MLLAYRERLVIINDSDTFKSRHVCHKIAFEKNQLPIGMTGKKIGTFLRRWRVSVTPRRMSRQSIWLLVNPEYKSGIGGREGKNKSRKPIPQKGNGECCRMRIETCNINFYSRSLTF